MTELVDYSSTASADWAALAASLKDAGKVGIGRYCVNDKSPNGRGIGADEYRAMTDAGLDVYLYWESSEGWMTGGYAAGVVAAVNAQNNITAAGMPHGTPVYFACDFDAAPEDQAAIDDCLRGCASVLGADRVGIYGGFWIVKRCSENGTAKWFCQTSAWSGGQWFAGNHLEQYAYNAYYAGTNCDLVRAQKENYGQASKHGDTPVPTPVPTPTWADPQVPEWFYASLKQRHPSRADVDGVPWFAIRTRVEAIANTYRYSRPDIKSPKAGPPVKVRDKVNVERVFDLKTTDAKGKPKTVRWLVEDTGAFLPASRYTPSLPVKLR